MVSFHQRQLNGKRLAAANAELVHMFAIQRYPDNTQRVMRVLDYGEMSWQKARNLTGRLTGTYIHSTYMGLGHVEANVNGPNGYATWGVPIIKVTAYNKLTGMPIE